MGLKKFIKTHNAKRKSTTKRTKAFIGPVRPAPVNAVAKAMAIEALQGVFKASIFRRRLKSSSHFAKTIPNFRKRFYG